MPCRIPVAFLCALFTALFFAVVRFWDDGQELSLTRIPLVEAGVVETAPVDRIVDRIAQGKTTNQSDVFSNSMRSLIAAADAGSAFHFRAPGLAAQEILLHPQPLFGPDFQLSIGVNEAVTSVIGEQGIRVYNGLSFFEDETGNPATVSLAIVGFAMHMEILAPDGSRLAVSGTDPQNVSVELAIGSVMARAKCSVVDGTARAMLNHDELTQVAGNGEDSTYGTAQTQSLLSGVFEPGAKVLGLAGVDPATGKLDRFVEPIPMGEQYALSLKEMLLLLVLDKEATGENTRENLAGKASQTIAGIASVATIYENQLGLRLLLQELIMIPDADKYADVPFVDPLGDFRDWCHQYRKFSRFGWTCAIKEGAGLRDGGMLGIANVARIHRRDAVAVVRSNSDNIVFAHEMAHNLGSLHTNGGIMSGRATANHRRSFFDDVVGEDGETAVKGIYSYAKSRLHGPAAMRHPEQMPFARSDFGQTGSGEPLVIQVLSNDADHVRHGVTNSVISVVETSRVLPDGAGSTAIRADGSGVEFLPAPDFSGTAWFSYTLRGNVGNESQGWLHKGDVAVSVGDRETSEDLQIRLRPGASYSFFPRQAFPTFTQPSSAEVMRFEDDRDLLIMRVSPGAEGVDSFQVGEDTYTITYVNEPPVAFPDSAWIDRYRSSVWIHPLMNDSGAGQLWLQQIDPLIGAGSNRQDAVASRFFATSMQLMSAENLNKKLGTIALEQLPVSIDGQSRQMNTGRIHFLPAPGAQGVETILYTVQDASGRRSEGQILVEIDTGYDTLVEPDAQATVIVPDAGSVDVLRGWTSQSFDDSGWRNGKLGIGYESNSGYENWIGTDVRDALLPTNTGVYVRVPFNVADRAAYSSLGFRARFDDGFVVYLNGRRVVSKNAPDSLAWNSVATQSDEHNEDEPFYVVDLTAHRDLLYSGENTLAVHAMNDAASSSDFLIQPVLVAYPAAPETPFDSPFFSKFIEWREAFGDTDGMPGGGWSIWDSDFDGYSDLVEFVAHGSPVDPASLPHLSVLLTQAGVRRTVRLRYFQRMDAAELGISYAVEQTVSNAVTQWQVIDQDALANAGGTVAVTPVADGFEVVDIRIPYDSRDIAQRFYRVRYGLPD